VRKEMKYIRKGCEWGLSFIWYGKESFLCRNMAVHAVLTSIPATQTASAIAKCISYTLASITMAIDH
jgi:hypothetical protein